MRHKRKIENRHAHQPEVAVVDFGGAVHIHRNVPCIELPLRTRQFAGSDRALAHQIVVGPVFLDNFSGKGKRIGRGQHVARLPQPQSHRSDYAIERPGFRADIVGAVAGLDVLVVRTAVERDVALQFAISGVRVVCDLIRIQGVSAIVNFHLSTQVVDRSILLLLHRPDRNLFLRLARRGQRLAGYYPRSEKQMTDECCRDKDSRAGDH